MKNKKIRLISIFLLTLIIAVFCGGYYVYDKVITFPNNEEENIIRNVMSEHKTIVDRKSALNSDFNTAIEAFGGVVKINKEDNIINLKSDKIRLEDYNFDYYLKTGEFVNNKEKFYEEISSNYKYYNEEKLELYLILFNYDCNNNITVDDIKSYVEDGDQSKQKNIWEYVNWYFEYGKNEYAGYTDYFSDLTFSEDENGEYRAKYGRVTFFKLTFEEQKEIFNEFNEMGILEEVKYKNNFY